MLFYNYTFRILFACAILLFQIYSQNKLSYTHYYN
ncbi:hypothetical protein ACFW04_009974 [Cataglyphis niger]